VRPFPVGGEVDSSDGMLVVRSRFQLADGSEMVGYLTPRPLPNDGLKSVHPVIVTNSGQVLFWCGVIEPEPDDIQRMYERLGKASGAQLFPIRFFSDSPLEGGAIRGEIPGFMVLEDWRTTRVRVVK